MKTENKNIVKAKCFKYGKLGHIAPKCRAINEKIKIEKVDKNKNPLTCFKCKKGSHIARDCR